MSSPHQPEFIVLDGKTGAGKTTILKHLFSVGYPVIIPEEIAAPRGSAFGSIGVNKPEPTQQAFEWLLLESYQKNLQ